MRLRAAATISSKGRGMMAPGGNHPWTGGDVAESTSRRREFLEFLAVFFTLFAGELLLYTAGYFESADGEYTVSILVATAVRDIGFALLAWALLSRHQAFDLKLPRTATEWGKELGWGIVLFFAGNRIGWLLSMVVEALNLDSGTPTTDAVSDPTTLVIFCLLTPLVAVGEESLFRVYVQTRLTGVLRGQRVLPVVLGSILFAAIHGYPLGAALVVWSLGLVLAISYQANGKIPRLVIAHTLWNLVAALW
jgi:membrane protease YdiL (CAAX protease family)